MRGMDVESSLKYRFLSESNIWSFINRSYLQALTLAITTLFR